ncbi:unnamed protein product, partial [Ixodes hexagonus]
VDSGSSKVLPTRFLETGRRYLVCVFGSCGPGCGICAPVRTGKRLSFRAVEYSPFLVGLEWRRTVIVSPAPIAGPPAATSDYQRTVERFGVTACWTQTEKHCHLKCGPEEAVPTPDSFGSYRLPADLFHGSVLFRVRAMTGPAAGTTLFRAAFHQKRLEPREPCDVTVRTLGWSVVRITWTSWPLRTDGFQAILDRPSQVTWCRAEGPDICSHLQLPRNASSVVLVGLLPFLRYQYTVRSFRGNPNDSDVLFSAPVVATRKDKLTFELFLYTEMLVVFLLAGMLTIVALLMITFILFKGLGLSWVLGADDDGAMVVMPPRERHAQGDHRRHMLARGRRNTLPRIHSRGDS